MAPPLGGKAERPEDPTRPDSVRSAPTHVLGTDEVPTQSADAGGDAYVPGRRVGPYRVLRQIGSGGMGAVYLAERADAEFEKQVALKLVHEGADRQAVLARFRQERQILAALEHPNVSRLLDGGTTEDGVPYFVMEYIEGQPITEYCDERRLPVPERLRLFLSVCAAVQYAHQNLIVHRDIKPGNILVGADGVPRLLDFGIAKLLTLTGDAATQTNVALTPAYASPEQVRGDPITTAADVYSLGVLLYELLTGRHPYRVKSRQPLDYLKAVVEQDAQRPSAAVQRGGEPRTAGDADTVTAATASRARALTPERLQVRLRGDLDNVVLLALRKEPHARYSSVEALAADVRRYLEGRPVFARKGTVAYRTLKFVRRHAWAVAAAAGALALLGGWTWSVKVQADRIARERDKADRIAAFMKSLFHVSNPGEALGDTVTAREVLDRGARQIREDLGGDPETRADLMTTMSEVYNNLGLFDPAIDLARESVEIRRQVRGPRHPELARSLNSLGNILVDKGDYVAAEAAYREALDIRRARRPPDDGELGESLNNLATAVQSRGNYAEAESLLGEALAVKRRQYGEQHKSVANTLSNLAVVRYFRGDYAGARQGMEQALAVQRQVLGEQHPDVAQSIHNIGVMHAEEGHFTDAERAYRDALERQRRVLGPDHMDVSITLHNLGTALARTGDLEGAAARYAESLAMQRRLIGKDGPDAATNLGGLASVARERGEPAEAERLWREALAIRVPELGEAHADVGAGLSGLALALADQGRAAEAADTARRAAAVRRKAFEGAHPEVADGFLALADVLARGGDPGECESTAREAVALLQAGPEATRWRAREADSVLGACLAAAGRFAEAETLLLSSADALSAQLGERGPLVRHARRRLLALYERWGRPDDAARYR